MKLLFVIFTLAHCEYVPLNSLTISSLYAEKPGTSSTEKPWWTDLQEKRQQFKAAKIRAQNLQFNNGKIINARQPEATPEELPKPISSTLPPSPEFSSGLYF